MSKGMYSFVAYPESSDIDKITETLTGSGAEWAWILHDKDNDKDGNPKKPHWHILAGWENHFPTWRDFKRMCKEVGAVAVSSEKCLVHDCAGVEAYLDHHNEPEKYQYSPDDIHISECFDSSSYQTKEMQRTKSRQARKQAAADADVETFTAWMDFVSEQDCEDFATLIQLARVNRPELLAYMTSNTYVCKSYLDSLRNCGGNRWRLEKKELTAKLRATEKQEEQACASLDHWKFEWGKLLIETYNLRELMRRYAAMVGDAVPEWYEIAANDGDFPEKEAGFKNIREFTIYFKEEYKNEV